MKKKDSKKSPKKHNEYLKYYILLGIIAFAVYANSLSNDFVFDDESVVLSDPTITTLSSIPKYLTGEAGFHKVIGRYYRPVVSASYAIDYAIWSFDPLGYHLTNIIIHIINTLLVLKLLMLIFGIEREEKTFRFYAVLLGAALFAVHPIHTEAVTWISGRTDSLSFTFFTAALICYLLYSGSPSQGRLVWMSVFYVLSLLAKEMAITLPVVIILFDIIVKRYTYSELKNKLNVYVLIAIISLAYVFLRWLILKDVPERDTYFYFYGKDKLTTLLTMLPAIPLYFRLLVVPAGLLYHYNGYMPYVSTFADTSVLLSVFVILLLIAAALYFFRKIPLVSYSILFFFVTLSPVLNIVPTMNFMAERFLYIPSLIISVIPVVFFVKYYSGKTGKIFYSVFTAVIFIFGLMTIIRNTDWKSNNSLFLSAEEKPGTVTYVNIGNIYANNNELDKAEVYYRKALDLRAETVLANDNLGKIFLVKGNFDSAYYYIHRAYLSDTLSPEPMFTMAQLYVKFNKIPEAVEQLENVQRVTPNYMNSASMLAELKMKMAQGNSPDQNEPLSKSSENVNRIAMLEQQSYSFYRDQKYTEAIAVLNRLIEINPVLAYSYYNNMGMCYKDMNKLDDAKKNFELAVQSKKDFSTGYNNLGSVYEVMGDKKKAKENYQKALDTDPNNQDAKSNLERVK